jgi:protein-S-isoprenylcysteine O-methyltransferase Ste14
LHLFSCRRDYAGVDRIVMSAIQCIPLFVIGIGFLLLSANWFVDLIYLGPLVVMYITRVSLEEQMMVERFGDSYRQYMKGTGRLWPRL